MLLESLAADVRYALRSLRSSPGFAAVAILSLGLAIGANTAIFSLIDAVMLRSLSRGRPGRRRRSGRRRRGPGWPGPPRRAAPRRPSTGAGSAGGVTRSGMWRSGPLSGPLEIATWGGFRE